MAAKFEDLVEIINTTGNPFELAHAMPEIKEGLTDLRNRLQELERGRQAPPEKPATVA